MTDEQIKQMFIDDHAKLSDMARQCNPRLPRTDYEWSHWIKTYRAMGGK